MPALPSAQTSTPHKWPLSFLITVSCDMFIWSATHMCRWECVRVLNDETDQGLLRELQFSFFRNVSQGYNETFPEKNGRENTKGLRSCLQFIDMLCSAQCANHRQGFINHTLFLKAVPLASAKKNCCGLGKSSTGNFFKIIAWPQKYFHFWSLTFFCVKHSFWICSVVLFSINFY